MAGRTVNACALLTAAVNCAPAGHSILRLWRGPSSRACSAGGMLEGWRYSHIVSGIQVPSHVYSEFAFSAIVISSEAEKSLSVFIFLTYFPKEALNPSQQKSTCTLRHMCFIIISD